MEWTDMMHYQQQVQKVMRSLLPMRKSVLTASECELLARLYLQPEHPDFTQSGQRYEKRSGKPLLKNIV